MAIAVEASELMDLFKWSDGHDITPQDLVAAQEELADVIILCLALANSNDFDVSEIVRQKLSRNRQKYPIDRYLGKWKPALPGAEVGDERGDS